MERADPALCVSVTNMHFEETNTLYAYQLYLEKSKTQVIQKNMNTVHKLLTYYNCIDNKCSHV